MRSRSSLRSSPSTRRDTPPPRGIVGHQHEVAAGQADKRGERRPLVAALVLVDLDDEFLALAHHILDARARDVDVVALEEGPAHLLEGQGTRAARCRNRRTRLPGWARCG